MLHRCLIAALIVSPGSLVSAATIFVDTSCGDDAWTGTISICAEPDGPKATIGAAIDAAVNGDEIVVAAGTYTELIDFAGKAVTLRSADGPVSTTIDGAGGGTVVTCDDGEGSDTVLSGFTIIGGNAVNGGGMRNDGSSPTVLDCRFLGNAADAGGGMFNTAGSPLVTNCIFSGNTADGGAAVENTAASNPVFTNCTFAGNAAVVDGGAMLNASDCSPAATNCAFWGDLPNEIAGAGTPTISYSNVQGGWSGDGTNNIDADPRFADADGVDDVPGTEDDDLRLLEWSPCIDAGDNAAVAVEITTDLDGNPRFIDDTGVADSGAGTAPLVDMGAYERQDASGLLIGVPDDLPSIQAALDITVDGSEIVVAAGTYVELIDFRGKAVTLRSTDGPASTTIDGAGAGTVVTCDDGEGSDTVLSGFTIIGGNAVNGGGMRNDGSSPTVLDCRFLGNAADAGGGMFNTAGSPLVINCIFSGNTADDGGAAVENTAASNPVFTNCTFAGNAAVVDGGAMRNASDCSPAATNCTFWGDLPDEIAGAGTPTISYSNVQGGWSGDGTNNIDADPRFADADGVDDVPGTEDDDLRLLEWSPCIDAGDNAAVAVEITTDLDGNPRFIDDTGVADSGAGTAPLVDMGAYERQDASGLLIGVPDDLPSIQAALDITVDGSEIVVAAGTYVELIDFRGKAVTLRSTDGPASTTIDGAGAGTVVTCVNGEGPGTLLEGFTITGGVGSDGPSGLVGGGMRCDGSSPTVRNCTFDGNTADDGGAIRNFQSSPTIEGCTFIGNSATDDGGAMCNEESNPTITDCTFSGNDCVSQGGAVFNVSSSPVVTNCTFSGNMGGWGGGMSNEVNCNPQITDCVFVDNTAASSGGGLRNFNTCHPTVTNCSFLGNTASTAGGGMANFSDSDPTVTNCIFSGNTAGNNGGGLYSFFISDPVVTNCTFSGNTVGLDGGGMSQFSDSHPTTTNCIFWGNAPDEISGDSAVTVSYSNVQGGWSGDGTNNIDVDPRFVDADGFDNVIGTEDDDLRRSAWSRCTDAGDNAAVPVEVTVDLDGAARFVDDPGVFDIGAGTPPIVDMGAYESQDASGLLLTVPGDLPSIQTAIDLTVDGAEIVVAAGTYVELIDFSGKLITLRSADGPAVTILDGGGLGTVVTCDDGEGVDTVLDGFTITGGTGSEGPVDVMVGGGMRCDGSNPTVTNCVFEGNAADDGGGLANFGSSPTVTRCTFEANAAVVNGGGIYNDDSSPVLTDCGFYGNTAETGGAIANVGLSSAMVTNCLFSGNAATGDGGAMHNLDSDPAITNCTFGGNTAGGDGGALHNGSDADPNLVNCILWGDAPNAIGGVGAPIVSFSDVEGGWSGGGGDNIDADPRFRDADGLDDISGTIDDDLRLRGASPCVDAGDNASVPADVTTDLDGGPRILDGDLDGNPVVDMGAYELEFASSGAVLNVTTGMTYDTIPDAIDAAADGHDLLAGTFAFQRDVDIDYRSKAIVLRSAAEIGQPVGGQIRLSDGAELAAAEGSLTTLEGDLVLPPTDVAVLRTEALSSTMTGSLVAGTNSVLEIIADDGSLLAGNTRVDPGGRVTFSGGVTATGDVSVLQDGALIGSRNVDSLGALLLLGGGSVFAQTELSNGGTLTVVDATITAETIVNTGVIEWIDSVLLADTVTNAVDASLTGDGDVLADVINDGTAVYVGNTLVAGDYDNQGTTIVQIGTLTILGTLTNDGTIIGDVVGGGSPGRGDPDGLEVNGDLVVGADTELSMPSESLRIVSRGAYDVAIDDHLRYDMAEAELGMSGAGGIQDLELMSEDIGPDPLGRDRREPGRFPLGTPRVGPSPATVSMVDRHDNDGLGQTMCEAIYVRDLIVHPDATLLTNGCRIYYVSATIDGAVDDPANLISIEDFDCPADVDDSGMVDFGDILVLLASWGFCPPEGACPADINDSGDVDFEDLLVILAEWGACP